MTDGSSRSGISSRWYKTDLQIASPAGGFKLSNSNLESDEGRERAASDYVQLLGRAGIEVFAVTDHNATSMLHEIRTAARAAGLVMFPGMELSTGTGSDGVHLLLLGDPDADLSKLSSQWLTAAGFNDDHPPFNAELHQPSPRSMIDILTELPEKTIAIAPHVLNDNGAASGASIKEASIKWRCLHHDRLEALDVGTPVEGDSFNDKFRNRNLQHFPALRRLAFVSTSDAYSARQLNRHTWIRMHQPNLDSLRQALLDYEARIFCDWDTRLAGRDPNEIKHAHIRSMHITGLSTSKEPLNVSFDPRLTVIIGSRGSGKSTIVQGLRAVYGDDANLPVPVAEESSQYRNDVFKDATIESEYVESISGSYDVASWRRNQGTSTAKGNSLINVRVVSQKELFERTSNDRSGARSASANMLALIDEALDDDKVAAELRAQNAEVISSRIGPFQTELERLREEYARAAAARLQTETRLAGRQQVEDNRAGASRKIAALDDEDEKVKLKSAQDILADKRSIVQYAAKAIEWAEAVDCQPQPVTPSLTTSIATRFFQSLQELSDRIPTEVAALTDEARRAVQQSRDALADAEEKFALEVSKADQIRVGYESRLAELGVDLSQYGALQDEQAGYETELKEIDELSPKLPAQRAAEDQAWWNLDKHHATLLSVREAFTEMVSAKTPTLKFAISPCGDHANWRSSIHNLLGFRLGDHVDALQSLADWIWDANLGFEFRKDRNRFWRDALLSNDYSEMEDAGLTPSFVSRLKQSSQATRIDLATLRADDALNMQFLKQGSNSEDPASWQTITHGSPGQRSAAMLAFTLSYGDSPLVLDQPEDDLDSALVSELIVTQFRDARWKRQLIVVTHEANIPVNADAERVVALENTAGVMRVIRSNETTHNGPIDDPAIRKDIQNLLEGGVPAFINRERRYDNELSKYRIDVGLMPKRDETS